MLLIAPPENKIPFLKKYVGSILARVIELGVFAKPSQVLNYNILSDTMYINYISTVCQASTLTQYFLKVCALIYIIPSSWLMQDVLSSKHVTMCYFCHHSKKPQVAELQILCKHCNNWGYSVPVNQQLF